MEAVFWFGLGFIACVLVGTGVYILALYDLWKRW